MLKEILKIHLPIFIFLLFFGVFFGVLYAFELIGWGGDLIRADIARSLHISFMLYGSIPLMLSLISIKLFDKDGIYDKKVIYFMHFYLLFWYIFLLFMAVSLSMGIKRDLPFYDFDYKLNFILAFSGIFYLISMLYAIKHYEKKPLWVRISLVIIILSPFALLFLMNPKYGEVEKTLIGPHGDNTLGMSFALIVIYYLVIKSFAKKSFIPKYNFLWVIPLVFYISSLFYKTLYKPLSYNQEWFLQYLTLLYIPLLISWLKEANIIELARLKPSVPYICNPHLRNRRVYTPIITFKQNSFLIISIIFFIIVDIEGNWLFIPHVRELFHRNNLVIGHAHLAMGVAVLFLALSVIEEYLKNKKLFYLLAIFIILMSLVLSIGGFMEAGYIKYDIELIWKIRAFIGVLALFTFFAIFVFFFPKRELTFIRAYHLIGFLSDGVGGAVLLFFGNCIYSFLNENLNDSFSKAVFGFMIGVGIIHLLGYLKNDIFLAKITLVFRIILSSIFYSLYFSNIMGISAMMIFLYDFIFAMVLIFYLAFKGKYVLSKKV